jgi:hypothetical protein
VESKGDEKERTRMVKDADESGAERIYICIHSSSVSISSYCLLPFLVLFLMFLFESDADFYLQGAAHWCISGIA